MFLDFDEVCLDVTKNAVKIPQSKYLKEGLYPIYDQGRKFVFGFSNDKDGLVYDVPYP